MVMAGRHDSPRSGIAVKRLAAGTRRLVPDALRRDPQDRWAAVFGRIAGYSFAVAVVTGVPLLLRAFFRGRFSGRALPDWLIWVALLPPGMLAAYTGTILPDDGLSGGSLGVITDVLLSVPVIGTHLVSWIFGGAPAGQQVIGRDYWVHILVLPALAGALLLLSFRPSLRWPRRGTQTC